MTVLARNLRSRCWHRWDGERSPCHLLTDWTRNEMRDSSTFTDEEIVDLDLCGHCFKGGGVLAWIKERPDR